MMRPQDTFQAPRQRLRPYQHPLTALALLPRIYYNLLLVLLGVPKFLWLIVHLNICHPLTPPPTTPGGCWRQLLSPHRSADLDYIQFRNSASHWVDRHTIKFLHKTSAAVAHAYPEYASINNWPFLRLQRIERGIYHVLPLDQVRDGKLYRITKLPKAWYGAGPTDPNFFSDSGLRNIALSLHMGSYANAVNTARRAAPYAVDKKQLHFLTKAGIDHPPPDGHQPPASCPLCIGEPVAESGFPHVRWPLARTLPQSRKD